MVQVPDGANPGSTIQVVNPSTGQPFQVQVPAGVYPGQTFQVQMPSPPAVAQAQPMYNQAPPQTVIIHESHQPYDNNKGGDDGCCACLLGMCACCTLCAMMD
ncbi:hypothetical protein FOL47_007383 [Perkinsus chesapeaki]|uniref:Cysteine-rich transmembrane CYSTM domain-containing protein n=1 Tax=Perkinsus chesapeaki TaxID=330153 RepID=A0A7J6LKV1_PERCH|nr:hypothetical protein FOL47_007383 [Perkinsus chesapeaki]